MTVNIVVEDRAVAGTGWLGKGTDRMNELTRKIKYELIRLGADIVGFGDLNELPTNVFSIKLSNGNY